MCFYISNDEINGTFICFVRNKVRVYILQASVFTTDHSSHSADLRELILNFNRQQTIRRDSSRIHAPLFARETSIFERSTSAVPRQLSRARTLIPYLIKNVARRLAAFYLAVLASATPRYRRRVLNVTSPARSRSEVRSEERSPKNDNGTWMGID